MPYLRSREVAKREGANQRACAALAVMCKIQRVQLRQKLITPISQRTSCKVTMWVEEAHSTIKTNTPSYLQQLANSIKQPKIGTRCSSHPI